MRSLQTALCIPLLIACDRPSTAGPVPSASASASTEPPVARTPPFGLPFRDGTWLVFWGGGAKDVNRHLGGPRSQRRAADLDRIDDAGRPFSGDGKRNEQHYCFGSDIAAMADGRIVFAVDGVPDNAPGEQDEYFTSGNAVMVDHGAGVWAEYCHLKLRSVRVREGDVVKRGAVIGQCGNSGSTTQPHLHVQIQDGARNETAWGVEGVFENVKVSRSGKDQTIRDYTFLKNDRIDATASTIKR